MSSNFNSPARSRIAMLLDENSFVETGALVRARSTDFIPDPALVPGDGVVTGYGTVDGRLVYVYAQDPNALSGSVGEMHAKKICALYDLALKTGYPVVGMLDSTGLRLEEASDALSAVGSIFAKMTEASGAVPQISAVFGSCGGALSILTELSDFVFMEKAKGRLFLHTPDSIKGNYEEKLNTASADFKLGTGAVDMAGSAEEVCEGIRSLLSFLPDNCEDEPYDPEVPDDLNRTIPGLDSFAGDTLQAAIRIADNEEFFEAKAGYEKSMLTGFMRLNGRTVGLIANRSEILPVEGKPKEKLPSMLTNGALRKAAAFVRFCDAFSLPILTLTNVRGFCGSMHSERAGAREAAALAAAFKSASVPKLNVIMKEAFGSAAIIMNSKSIGADYVYAWENARVGAMEGKAAAEVLYGSLGDAERSEKAEAYDSLKASAAGAAGRGYVDTVIAPEDTRKYVIGALEMLYGKDGFAPDKKHLSI